MKSNLFASVVLCAGLLLGACGSTPVGPAPPPTPTQGTINIVYQAATTCLSAGTPFAGRCDRSRTPTTFNSISWPSGYSVAGLVMTLNADGTLTASATAPSTGVTGVRLRITIADPWLCPAQQ